MSDPLWYKDAVIYQLHVKSFFDSNADGIGDFAGLVAKLDYIQSLGVSAIWLLPFYPSPLRDDGYDIAHYEGIHPSYGTRRDFRVFLREAKARGLRVIIELVVNHTSDQHPWFQASRTAPPGSSKRNYYVWSDTSQKYADARVIFTDSEKSNWTWDDEAQAYYWHRFFHHQPDLNFDNPSVRWAVLKIMRFWFDLGVDGLRLDAVPYLIEREGTNCENLPETHGVLKELRQHLDARHSGRMLLAEANQWPSDVRAYFGDGDECHMAYHFPLMPRMFMAVQQEDRHPITEILRQTPDIPDLCQWALFLRNHDELTLEMVTDAERDYMYQAYAADPQMRLNIGIRRRLAPLLENNRERIELMTSLLFSFPGTPIIYYGDELGMGDNIYLGDRDGVRTPMQWTGDRNGGFSRADPARLFAPPIMDPVYGYQAINVEAQERAPSSLLNWMRRLISLRQQHQVFGRGDLEFLDPPNRKILAFTRSWQDETILVIANLARTLQPAELNLSKFEGLVPVEMLGGTAFPPIGQLPYFVTVAPHGFCWFKLMPAVSPITAAPPLSREELDALPVLYAGPDWEGMFESFIRTLVERDALATFLGRQRWFGGKGRQLKAAVFGDWVTVRRGGEPAFLTFVDVEYAEGPPERYFVPLLLRGGDAADETAPEAVLARVSGARNGVLCDATIDDEFSRLLLEIIRDRTTVDTKQAQVSGAREPALDAVAPDSDLHARRASADQSNTSVIFGEQLILKLLRKLESGPSPELEIGRHLGKMEFDRVPPLAGAVEYRGKGDTKPTTLAVLQGLVQSQANGWEHAIEELHRYFDRVEREARTGTKPDLSVTDRLTLAAQDPPALVQETVGGTLKTSWVLGRRTAELHLALAAETDDADFQPEPVTEEDQQQWAAGRTAQLDQALGLLRARMPELSADTATSANAVLAAATEIEGRLTSGGAPVPAVVKTRVHGDYHLGQVLWVEADFVILDFEGEPARPIEERRLKQSPLKDVAGMLRSYGYAARVGLQTHTRPPETLALLEPWADLWEVWSASSFLCGYLEVAGDAPFLPASPAELKRLLETFVLDKAVYELMYELNNRPDWVVVPLRGLLGVIQARSSVDDPSPA